MATPDLETMLSAKLDAGLVHNLCAHYRSAKKAWFCGDWEDVGLRAGKLVETSVRILQHLTRSDGSYDTGQISVIPELERIMRLPATSADGSLRLRIPRALISIYDRRSTRNMVHTSTEVDPSEIDATAVLAECDWVFAEFVRLYAVHDPARGAALIRSLVRRNLPIVEEIDGDVLVLRPDMKYKDQMLLVLYQRRPARVSNDVLRTALRHKPSSYVATYLRVLEKERLVHRNANGAVLTSRGVAHVEDAVAKLVEAT